MSTTYIDRANTNHEVYRRANLEMGLGAEEIIRPLSDVLQEKRLKLLGHIIRRTRDHPQHQATFATRIFLSQQVEHRRAGRPRAAWTYETMKDCWRKKNHNIAFQIQNREHREQIKTWALNRQDPFWQSLSPIGRTAAVVVPTGLTQTYGLIKKKAKSNKQPSTKKQK